MTYLEAERKLVIFLGEILDSEPDRGIFAGELPDGVTEGVTVDLTEGRPATLTDSNAFSCCIAGHFSSRKICRSQAFAITSKLPVYGKNGLLSVNLSENIPLKFTFDDKFDGKIHTFTLALDITFI
ncbi:MAG: hypothetical protein E7044_03740 [Lentisphaerae bacterium]|nr:hypothetical protein [Lentisphaerota bacterium]